MFVDPRGRIHGATELFAPDTRTGTLETTDRLTLYSRTGDWPGWVCAVASMLVLLGAWGHARRRGEPPAPGV